MASPTLTSTTDDSTYDGSGEFKLENFRLVNHRDLTGGCSPIEQALFNDQEELSQFLNRHMIRYFGGHKPPQFPLKLWFCKPCIELLKVSSDKMKIRHETSDKHISALQRLFPDKLLGKAGYECPHCHVLFRDDHLRKHLNAIYGPRKARALGPESSWKHLSPGSWPDPSSSPSPLSERYSSSPSPQPSSLGAPSPTSSSSSLPSPRLPSSRTSSSHHSSTNKPYARLTVRKAPSRTRCAPSESSAGDASPTPSEGNNPQIKVSAAPPVPVVPSQQTLVAPRYLATDPTLVTPRRLDADPTTGHLHYPFANYTPADFKYGLIPPGLEPQVVQQPYVTDSFNPDTLVFPDLERYSQPDQVTARSTPHLSLPKVDPSQHRPSTIGTGHASDRRQERSESAPTT